MNWILGAGILLVALSPCLAFVAGAFGGQRWAAVTALVIGTVLIVTGCAFDARPMFYCPHGEEVKQVDRLVSGRVERLPWFQTQTRCSYRAGWRDGAVVGCVFKGVDWHMAIFNGLSATSEVDTYFHELCHIYEVEVLGIPIQTTATHAGWWTKRRR